MSKEKLLDSWGAVFMWAGVLACCSLFVYGGLATREYNFDSWGSRGLSPAYVYFGIAALAHGLLIKLVLNALAELIRVAKVGRNTARGISQIDCPACAEEIKSEARVCCHCRYVVEKHVWKLPIKSDGSVDCPKCNSSITPTEKDKENAALNCAHCKKHILFKIGDPIGKPSVVAWQG